MAIYKVRFQATVTIEAETESEAIKKAWLLESLHDATFKYLDCVAGKKKEAQ